MFGRNGTKKFFLQNLDGAGIKNLLSVKMLDRVDTKKFTENLK